ncbi:MAG TPA: DUF3857 domain-containing protein, partial [Chthonomonadales bacterium]|nr:DUF3857 domain-containing protein [Chthonomonadales bacterium]
LFNERARSLAEVSIPYNSSYQTVRILHARTIKPDGTVIAVKPEDIRSTSPFSDYLMYDDALAVSFSMPAIEDNCVIDYTYEMVTKPLLMRGKFWAYWGFSDPFPVSLSRYTLSVPATMLSKAKVYNDDALKPYIQKLSPDGKFMIFAWQEQNLKPLVVEPAMPDLRQAKIWMEVSSIGSWQDIAKWFWGLQSPQAKPSDAIRGQVARLIDGKTTDQEKAKAIYNWVANSVRYVGLEFGLSAFRPHSASEVFQKLYGDCKDKATLLITMLNIAGIKAWPVLLTAGEQRPVENGLPTLDAFDHCIAQAQVAGKIVWLDATAETCSYGDIPEADRGAHALVVRDGTGEFQVIPAYSPDENGLDTTTRVTLHNDGSATSHSQISLIGGAGQLIRSTVRAITPDRRKEMMQQIAGKISSGATLIDFLAPDGKDKSGPYTMNLTISAPNYARITGSLLLLPVASGTISDRPNEFVKDTRVWPIVETESYFVKQVTTVSLPAGVQVVDVPADLNLTGPLHSYLRVIKRSADGKSLVITESDTETAGTIPAASYSQ